jgi:hypothetical protein
VNPCRRNIFDVFQIDKSETDIASIRNAIREARNRLGYGEMIGSDGTKLELSEAELNNMESVLLDPVARLKEELFVHQAHPFLKDQALAGCIDRLAALEKKSDAMKDLISETRKPLLTALARFLPPLSPLTLEDDLPWPEPPAPMPITRKSLEEGIFSDEFDS